VGRYCYVASARRRARRWGAHGGEGRDNCVTTRTAYYYYYRSTLSLSPVHLLLIMYINFACISTNKQYNTIRYIRFYYEHSTNVNASTELTNGDETSVLIQLKHTTIRKERVLASCTVCHYVWAEPKLYAWSSSRGCSNKSNEDEQTIMTDN